MEGYWIVDTRLLSLSDFLAPDLFWASPGIFFDEEGERW